MDHFDSLEQDTQHLHDVIRVLEERVKELETARSIFVAPTPDPAPAPTWFQRFKSFFGNKI